MLALLTARSLRGVRLALLVLVTAAPVAAQTTKPSKATTPPLAQAPTPKSTVAVARAGDKPAASGHGTQASAQTNPPPDVRTAVLGCFAALESTPQTRRVKIASAEVELKKVDPSGDCVAAVTNACSGAVQGDIDYGSEVLANHRRTCLAKRAASTTAGPVTGATVASDIVQSVAQVIVTKAQAVGWQLLIDRLNQLARCPPKQSGPPSPIFPGTCKVLASLDLKDLVSSPKVLLDAVVADLLTYVETQKVLSIPANGAAPPSSPLPVNLVETAFLEASKRWPQSGLDGVTQAFLQAILDHVKQAEAASCEAAPTLVEKYSYVLQMCLIEVGDKGIAKCAVQEIIDGCTVASDNTIRPELSRLWQLTAPLFPATGTARPVDALTLIFALGQDEIDDWENGVFGTKPPQDDKDRVQSYFGGGKALAIGLVTKDWVSATSGAVRILETIAKASNPNPDGCSDKEADCVTAKQHWDMAQVLRVLAAVGNYALTFDTSQNPDPGAAADAREKIIAELVDRMVNRTDRTSGTVVSFGGTLGALGGVRFAKTDKLRADYAFPVQLALGVGLQTYATSTGGFHALLSVIDLGQYVNLNDSGSLQVGSPDLKSALGLGVTAGGWFALRETPAHIAAHFSISPFNRADGKPTFQAGLVAGIYVPLLDFN